MRRKDEVDAVVDEFEFGVAVVGADDDAVVGAVDVVVVGPGWDLMSPQQRMSLFG